VVVGRKIERKGFREIGNVSTWECPNVRALKRKRGCEGLKREGASRI
jgi:hypothetical protein